MELFNWRSEHEGIEYLPVVDMPGCESLAALVIQSDETSQEVLWLSRDVPLTSQDLEAVMSTVKQASSIRVPFPQRNRYRDLESVLSTMSQGRRQAAHILRGRISNLLVNIWLKSAALPETGITPEVDAIRNDLEHLRIAEVGPLSQALYPLHVHWSLSAGLESVAHRFGLKLFIGPGLAALDDPLTNPMPVWFRVALVDYLEVLCAQCLQLEVPLQSIRVNTHARDRLHCRISLRKRSGTRVETRKLLCTLQVVHALGGIFHTKDRGMPQIELCLPYGIR